ncbi:hypothetical protein E6C27_scaffold223G00500 [Cucumis melo var. makuwa]|uniref:Uncharacterized protein n=1 Tax=Cucumis melo var. makuwa TaxID=1194695 RepID=A0A5A7SMU6_CUCMM|nr:hypothetical protein E6C27_scaffold223G00500 [Cucumis melo var. makuwa]
MFCFTVSDPTSTDNDRAFAVRSIALVGTIKHLHSASPSAIQLLLDDDRAFTVRSIVLSCTIIVILERRRRSCIVDVMFGEVESELYHYCYVREVEAKLYQCRLLGYRQSCTVLFFLERGRQSYTTIIILETQKQSCTIIIIILETRRQSCIFVVILDRVEVELHHHRHLRGKDRAASLPLSLERWK